MINLASTYFLPKSTSYHQFISLQQGRWKINFKQPVKANRLWKLAVIFNAAHLKFRFSMPCLYNPTILFVLSHISMVSSLHIHYVHLIFSSFVVPECSGIPPEMSALPLHPRQWYLWCLLRVLPLYVENPAVSACVNMTSPDRNRPRLCLIILTYEHINLFYHWPPLLLINLLTSHQTRRGKHEGAKILVVHIGVPSYAHNHNGMSNID